MTSSTRSAFDEDDLTPKAGENEGEDTRFKQTYLIHAVKNNGDGSSQIRSLGSEGEAKGIAQKMMEDDDQVQSVQVFVALPKSIAKRVTRVEFFS